MYPPVPFSVGSNRKAKVPVLLFFGGTPLGKPSFPAGTAVNTMEADDRFCLFLLQICSLIGTVEVESLNGVEGSYIRLASFPALSLAVTLMVYGPSVAGRWNVLEPPVQGGLGVCPTISIVQLFTPVCASDTVTITSVDDFTKASPVVGFV